MSMGIGAINAYTVSPMNYSIKNGASFSDAYTSSVKGAKQAGKVGSVSPVRYPDATIEEAKDDQPAGAAAVEKSQAAEKAFNTVADKFSGMTTGYDAASAGYGYGTVGSTIDLYA